MTESRRRGRRGVGPLFPAYGDFIRLGGVALEEFAASGVEISIESEEKLDLSSSVNVVVEVEAPSFPSYSEFTQESAEDVEAIQAPSYADFLMKGEEEAVSENLAPAYSSFIDYGAEETETEIVGYAHFLEYGLQSGATDTEDVSFDELIDITDDKLLLVTKVKKTKLQKFGIGSLVLSNLLGWGAIIISLIASRNVEIYMFAPAVLAIIFAIVGERTAKKATPKYAINSFVFSVFTLLFPAILVGIGWLTI